jgi:tol-pal system protein YbgF
MRYRLILCVAVLAGCAGTSARESTATIEAARGATTAGGEIDDASQQQAARIRELEARLALQSSEARELRHELASSEGERPSAPAACAPSAGDPEIAERDEEPPDEVEDRGPRPLLRLYGPPRPAAAIGGVAVLPGSIPPAVVAPPPELGAYARLPVVAYGGGEVPAIPEHPIAIAPVAPDAPGDDPIVREYQAALTHVEARRFDLAHLALARFAREHEGHPYADNALYWQGEVLFIVRDYRRAIATFEALIARYPRGNKTADALLRIGLSHERLGDRERARAYFRRVRDEHPGSVAARLASREET